jgi:hypothetical protein
MANSVANLTITATSASTGQVLFDVNGLGDASCAGYLVHNRDATNYVRFLCFPLDKITDQGRAVGPGDTIPVHFGSSSIDKIVCWTEGGTPAIDGQVYAHL